MTEEDFTEWKDNTRQNALEREVQRLRELSQKQSGKLGALRRIVYFMLFFFVVLFSILLVKGMLVFPGNDTGTVVVQLDTIVKDKISVVDSGIIDNIEQYVPDTIPVPLKETKGIVYCVQIGAYTGINLDEYKENLVSLQQDSYEGINQLTLGRFVNHDKANEFLAIIRQIGFRDAFIMSFKNGRRVPLKVQETSEMQSESNPPVSAETSPSDSVAAGDNDGSNL